MKFGIFYEHQLPRPWSGESEQTAIDRDVMPEFKEREPVREMEKHARLAAVRERILSNKEWPPETVEVEVTANPAI